MTAWVKRKAPMHCGLLFAMGSFTWWIVGMVYTLGHTLFTGLLPRPVYHALSYPIAGPFLLISEYLLSGHVRFLYHVVLAMALGFVIGVVFGLLRAK